MKKIKIENLSKKNVVVENALLADSFFYRLRGLLGKKELSEGEGLLIKPCSSVHMFFMRFSIDVLFMDKDDVVCGIVENLKPWQISPYHKNSKYVIELECGGIKQLNIQIGDKLNICK